MIEFGGQFSYRDFRAAKAATSGLRRPYRWMLCLVLGVVGLSLASTWGPQGVDPRTFLRYAGIAVLMVVVVAANRIAQRRAFETRAGKDSELRGTADAEGIELRSDRSSSRTAWSLFQKVAVQKDLILLYQTSATALYLPRTFFASDEDFARIGEWAKAGVQAPPLVHWPTVLKLGVWVLVAVTLLVLWTTFSSR